MKKSLIALAVLAASGASFAQSTVTIYGLVDAALVRTTVTGQDSVNKLTSGALTTSRFGFKGSEDLGGGLKANFLLEEAFDASNGTATAGFSREAWVGFSGGFGEVKLGKVSSAYNDVEGSAAAVFGASVGPVAVAFQSDAAYKSRPANTIYYATPTFSGVTGRVSYSLDEKVAAVAAVPADATPAIEAGLEVVSVSVDYAAGPLYAALGYQTEQSVGAAIETKYTQLNVTYDLGVAKLLGAVGHVGNALAISGDKVSEWQLGVDVPLSSALTLSTGYARSKATFANGAADTKTSVFAIGASYALSKRTLAYVAADTSKVKPTDVTTNNYAVGVMHKF